MTDETPKKIWTPDNPTSGFDAKVRIARAAIAERVLMRRRMLPYVLKMRPRYLAGWVHKVICHRLETFSEAVEKGLSPRLMILVPPRHGKSTLASEMFPAWHLGRYPHHEIIASSYNVSLPIGFSRKVRDQLRDPTYQRIFEHTRLHPDSQSNEAWLTTENGGYIAAGVGGGITGKGAHCVASSCTASTRGGIIPFSDVRVGDFVLGYDHEQQRDCWTEVRAVSASTGKDFLSVGGVLATEEHRFWLDGTGYRQAAEISRADLRLLRRAILPPAEGIRPHHAPLARITDVLFSRLRPENFIERAHPRVPTVQRGQSAARGDVQAVLLLRAREKIGSFLQWVRGCVSALRVHFCERIQAAAQAGDENVLHPRVLSEACCSGRGRADGELRDLRGCPARARTAVLFDEVLSLAGRATGAGGALLEFLVWGSLRYAAAGQAELPPVRADRAGAGGAPHRSRRDKPCAGELDHAVPALPRQLSSVFRGTSPRDLRPGLQDDGRDVFAVDLQTTTENFYCNGVLLHNCLIVDDPIKDAKEADSVTTRDDLWDWYGSTAYTRLSPGGGVLWIQTWWNSDDGAGRIQQHMQEDEDFDRFEIIKFPAIAEEDEYLGAEYNLYRASEGDIPPGAELVRSRGDPLHADRYTLPMLRRIEKTLTKRHWSALYQQNPTPEDGLYFTRDQFLPVVPLPGNKRRARGYRYQAFDFAITDKTRSDFTVGATMEQDSDDHMEVVDILRGKWTDGDTIVERMLDAYEKWTPDVIGVEDGAIWKTMSATFAKRARERGLSPNLEILKTLGNDKGVRATPLQVLMQRGRLRWPKDASWYDTAERELLRFLAGGNHDDIVDALAWCAQMASRRAPPPVPKDERKKSWRDKLDTLVNSGRAVNHMVA